MSFWWILGGILCDLELQESKQETRYRPANQKVPGFQPTQPGPTLSPAHDDKCNIPNVTQLVDLCLACYTFSQWLTDALMCRCARKFQDICKKLRIWSKFQKISGQLLKFQDNAQAWVWLLIIFKQLRHRTYLSTNSEAMVWQVTSYDTEIQFNNKL